MSSEEFDPNVTHIIAPPTSRTLKTFAASLTSSWLITDPQWVFDSIKVGHWLAEGNYGVRFDLKPFEGKPFYVVHLVCTMAMI